MPPFKANPHPVDPHAFVPAAVRRAAEAADAAIQAAQPQPQPQPELPPQPNDTITLAPPPEPQRLPGQVPLQIAAEPPPPPPQPEPPPPAQPPTDDAATWKNRYESMLGRFREANAQLVTANSRIEALENMLAEAQSQPARGLALPAKSLITPKDEEEMGPEMIDFVRRVSTETAAPLLAEIERLNNKINGTVQDVAVTARQRMHNELDEKLPNWNEINHDPEFHAWLALQDNLSGVIRHALLTQAYAKNDASRVLAIFKSFVSETAAHRPANPSTVPTPAAQQPVRPTLEELAAPGRARTAASPQAPAEKQLIRTSDINAFYAAVRRGNYRGREELQRQYEQELQAAMQEGRVVTDT